MFFFIAFSSLFFSKSILFFLHNYHYRKDHNKFNVIIVGTKTRAQNTIMHLSKFQKYYKIIGCLDTNKKLNGEEIKNGVKVIGSLNDLKEILLNNIVDEVIFSMPLKQIDSVDEHILLIEKMGIQVRIFPDWYIHSTVFQPEISKIAFDDFRGSPTIILTATNQNYLSLLIKSTIDILTAIIFLILL